VKPAQPPGAAAMMREMALLQLKLLLDAARDLVLSPVLLIASLVDLAMLKQQPPRYFHNALRLGKRSDEWIDLWAAVEDRERAPENVDALVQRVETLIRDPATGARQARVLKRWLEMSLARQRRRPPPTSIGPPPPP
jgi:hypothetical protein